MSDMTVSSTYAAEIAGIHKQRFNEAVARGDYPCAPPVRGKARVFQTGDIIALWMYGHLIEDGLPPSKAGELACDLQTLLRQYPDLEDVVLIRDLFRRRCFLRPEDIESYCASLNMHKPPVSVETWDLRPIRSRIAACLEQIARTFIHPDDGADED